MVALLAVAVALGLDNFAASVGIGVSGAGRSVRVRVAVVFGLFETAMPIVGVLLGRGLAGELGGAARWTGGALLVAAGAYELIRALRERRAQTGSPAPREPGSPAPREQPGPAAGADVVPRDWSGWRLVLIGAGLSVDNLAVGFALGTTRVPAVVAAIVFGVVSVGMSMAGLELGAKIGVATGRRGELLAGLVLIAVGVLMATGRL